VETLKDIAQIIFYLSLSVSGPLAVYEYLKARKVDRLAREYEVFNELDNRLFEYQKLALLHPDLDILDLPGKFCAPGVDQKQKQELIAYSMLFSLFQRAFLMFKDQTVLFQDKQWTGWKLLLEDLLPREPFQAAWNMSKHTFDKDFQSFMDRKIQEAAVLGSPEASSNRAGDSSCPKK
jgi:hypothetical protein